MLVLTRKPAETIHIGEDVVVKVIKTGSGTVKIGIEAPDEVRILRGEVVDAGGTGTPDTPPSPAWVYGGVQSDQFPHVA